MANRVNVNVNVNDNSARGLGELRMNLRRMQRQVRQAGGDVRFRVNLDPGTSRRDARRIRRQLRGLPVTIRTRLDPPTTLRGFRQRIVRGLGGAVRIPVRLTTRGMVGAVRGPLRSLGGFAGGIMQDGIGQGLINGFKAGGPVGIAFLGTLLLGLVSVIGAALSGLLVVALGAAFVGVGAVSAAMSEEVKTKWSDVLGTLKSLFADVGKPLIPVLMRSLDLLESMAKRAAPALKEALERTAPATEKFIQSLMKGFESFGKGAFDRIMEAWNVFAPVFGEEWDSFMADLGDAFGDMADLVKQHPTEIAMALNIVFETITLIVRAVTFLGNVWVGQMRVMTSAAGFVATGMSMLLDGFLGAIDGMLAGLESLAGVLGLDGPIKRARENLAGFRSQAVEKLAAIGRAGRDFGLQLDRANKKRRLEADISSWQSKLAKARADLKRTADQKAKAKLRADISDLNAKIASARAKLNALNGKTATTYVKTVTLSGGRAGGAGGTRGGRLEHGGIVGAAQTGGVRNNLTLVGEAGPEIVQLPTGSRVRSNPDTRRMFGQGGGGGGGTARLFIDAAGDDTSQFLLKVLRHAIRDQGGDVQVVLGRG